jgi:hypothetical protein
MKTKSFTVSNQGKATAMDALWVLVLIETLAFYQWFTELIAGLLPDVRLGALITFLTGSLCVMVSLFLGARYHSDVSNRQRYGHEPISQLHTFGEASMKALGVWFFITSLTLFSRLLYHWQTQVFDIFIGYLMLIILFIISVGFFVIGSRMRMKRLEKKP